MGKHSQANLQVLLPDLFELQIPSDYVFLAILYSWKHGRHGLFNTSGMLRQLGPQFVALCNTKQSANQMFA